MLSHTSSAVHDITEPVSSFDLSEAVSMHSGCHKGGSMYTRFNYEHSFAGTPTAWIEPPED